MTQQTFTHYWVTKKGEGVIAGPLADLGYTETVMEGFDDRTDLAVVELVPLCEYLPNNYLRPGTVALREHERAKVAGSGGALAVRQLADAIHGLASKAGPNFEGGSDYLIADVVHDLCATLIRSLDLMDHGWDGGTVSDWAFYVSAFVGREQE